MNKLLFIIGCLIIMVIIGIDPIELIEWSVAYTTDIWYWLTEISP